MNSTLGRNVPARNVEDEYVLPLKDLLQILWKRLWIVVLAVVLAVGVTEGFTLMQTPQYEASIKILVGQEGGGHRAARRRKLPPDANQDDGRSRR